MPWSGVPTGAKPGLWMAVGDVSAAKAALKAAAMAGLPAIAWGTSGRGRLPDSPYMPSYGDSASRTSSSQSDDETGPAHSHAGRCIGQWLTLRIQHNSEWKTAESTVPGCEWV
jgi:hypothetical protein